MPRILRYVSDLHLELCPTIYHPKLVSLWTMKQTKNYQFYLALLGDIGNPFNDNLKNFLEKIASKYQKIFYVPGNHEYYNYKMDKNRSKTEFDTKLKEICGCFTNVILMNNSTYDLENVKIIGSTLWSHIPDTASEYIKQTINDYHLIKKLDTNNELINITPNDTNNWNIESIDFIKKEIQNATKPCIVLTHHAPLFSNDITEIFLADPKYLNSKNNYAFHNNLRDLIKSPVCAWMYGHTHYAGRFKLNGVIVASNQLGYLSEQNQIKFDPYGCLNLNDLY